MRKIVFLLGLIVFTVVLNAQNNQVMVNDSGEYVVVRGSHEQGYFKNTGISCDAGAEKYSDYFAEAIAKPDAFVVTDSIFKLARMTGLFSAINMVNSLGIKYESNEHNIAFIESDDKILLEGSSIMLIPVMLSVLFMVILNILPGRFIFLSNVSAIIAFCLAVGSAVFVAPLYLAATFAGLAALAIVIIMLVFSLSQADYKQEKSYLYLSLAYYASMAIYFAVMFSGAS